ncbi:MAG TPA: hypothetical protein ENN33_10470 [Ignavibacteria bacterium]|nr:hypothetical protein [Ignavibacteria bacterium]
MRQLFLFSPRRTVTETNIINFAGISGDYFYAHMDKLVAVYTILTLVQRKEDN